MTTPDPALIPALSHTLETELASVLSYEALKEKLSGYFNDLILHDFNKLVRLLYRIDVSEAKLKYWLKENADKDAGALIADLVIEREMQKIETRKKFAQRKDESEEEKW